ncbi:hypothetical protein OH492_09095 [Vibrio chagasii]|nr:hypothetical protein [Vibrio chagasii]
MKAEDQLNVLELVHFHLGSQMANAFVTCAKIMSRRSGSFYCELRDIGAPTEVLRCWWWLGSRLRRLFAASQSSNSMNYGLYDAARNIVMTVGDICKLYNQPQPVIISESGRSLTAHRCDHQRDWY